jgi:predicted metal-dependent hydrolase
MNLFGPRLADGERLEIDGLVVRLSVSRRARRVSLRIDPARHEVVAVAPSERRLRDAWAFARERRSWALARLALLPPAKPLLNGDALTIFDDDVRLVPNGRRPRLVAAEGGAPARLIGCGDEVVDPTLVARAVKREALSRFRARAAIHCRSLGLGVPPIAIADARTRWGSCTPARAGRAASIRISWRLAFAPFPVADYVVAHECAHLLESNHGPRFWMLVRRLVGDEKPHRAWLRANGASLHALGS